jgi:capsular exopolysaccharide synthesis family protein
VSGAAFDSIWTLRDYGYVLRRRWRLALLIAILTPVSALVASKLQPQQYEAHANVLLSSQNLVGAVTGVSDPTLLQPDRVAATQADVAASPPVADSAVQAAGLQRSMTGADLLNNSSVTANPNADILEFAVRSSSPSAAVRLVNAYANAYTQYRQQLDVGSITKAQDGLKAAIEQAAKTSGTHSDVYTTLTGRLQQLNTIKALETSKALVYRQAQTAAQIAPRTKRNVALGVVLGVLVGISAAFLIERLRGSSAPASAGDLSRELGQAIIGYVPWHTTRNGRYVASLVEPEGPDSETFRQLRTALELIGVGTAKHSLMITSALEGEGKSTVAVNLAVSLRRAGKRVILVDLDLRRPTVAEYFGLPPRGLGLSDVALGRTTLEQALTEIQVPGSRDGSLRVLTAGRQQRDIGELVVSPATRAILKKLQTQSEVLILDVPPLLPVADGFALGAVVDSVALVIRPPVHTPADRTELARLLDQMPAEKLGLIISGESPLPHGYGYGATPVYPHLANVAEAFPNQGSQRRSAKSGEAGTQSDL